MPFKKVVFTPEVMDLIRTEALTKNAKQIAEMIGSTPGSVYAKCHESGIKIRKSPGAKSIKADLGGQTRVKLECKAIDLGVSVEVLVRKLLTIIVEDNLFNAILEQDEKSSSRK
jgi:hypothetical protein